MDFIIVYWLPRARRALALLLAIGITHNPVFASFIGVGFLVVVPARAIADAFTDKAAQGQALGAGLVHSFAPPDVDSNTGQITLQNGMAAGQTVQQGAMFQELQTGAMDAAKAAYGDNTAMVGVTANTQATLIGANGQYPKAYQTLMGARHANVDLSNDPIWQVSDATLSGKNGLIDSMFSGCTDTNTRITGSNTAHIPDYKTCKKSLAPQGCTVQRTITVLTATFDILSDSGDGTAQITTCGATCLMLTMSRPAVADGLKGAPRTHKEHLVIDIHDVSVVAKATITAVSGDDDIALQINGNQVMDLPGTGNMDVQPWSTVQNIDVTNSFQAASTVTLDAILSVSADTNRPSYSISIKLDLNPPVSEQFFDKPQGCRANLFKNWASMGAPPAWAPSGSTNDTASTPYWKCTDADYSRVIGGVTIDSNRYGPKLQPILPDAPTSPPAPICYAASLRVPESGSMACWTDTSGVQHCPSVPVGNNDDCGLLSSNPSCAYVSQQCINGATDPATGECNSWTVTYDCGTGQPVIGGSVVTDSTLCGGAMRCMGTECIQQALETNPDFGKAAGALSVLQGMQMDSGCSQDTGKCEIFKGQKYTCKSALGGYVDCCQTPNINVSLTDYIELAYSSWQVADRTGLIDTLTQGQGIWGSIENGATSLYSSITGDFTSAYESLGGQSGSSLDIAGTLLSTELGQQIAVTVTQWAVDVFGAEAVHSLVAFSSVAANGGAETVTAVSGLTELAGSIMTGVAIVGLIYAVLNILIHIIFACEQEEFELGYKKQMKQCHFVGSFCATKTLGACIESKDSYCCFNSPLARIIQEQGRPQLPDRPWGQPENPDCAGLTVNDIQHLDFNKIDLSEWVGILTSANLLPSSATSANGLYSLDKSTSSHLQGVQPYTIKDRVTRQFQNSNIDATRQTIKNGM